MDEPPLSPTGDPDEAAAAVREPLRDASWLLVATDFDGTLSEIVPRSAQARIRPDAQEALASLATEERTAVAVVSGRALDDVRDRVGLDGPAYAGNHGLEIETGSSRFVHPGAADAAEAIQALCAELRERLGPFEGTEVEEKGLTATVHYRRVDDSAVDDVERTVRSAVDRLDASLLAEEGRGIVEIKPAVDWDKGRAIEWLVDVLAPDDGGYHPVYLGDDVTDEDAFRALADNGTTVVVDPDPDGTAADYAVRDPAAVTAFLEWLAELRGSVSVSSEEDD